MKTLILLTLCFNLSAQDSIKTRQYLTGEIKFENTVFTSGAEIQAAGKNVYFFNCRFESVKPALIVKNAANLIIIGCVLKSDTSHLIVDFCKNVYIYNTRTFGTSPAFAYEFLSVDKVYIDGNANEGNDEREYLRYLRESVFTRSTISSTLKTQIRTDIDKLLK